jgi:hypothetical protein
LSKESKATTAVHLSDFLIDALSVSIAYQPSTSDKYTDRLAFLEKTLDPEKVTLQPIYKDSTPDEDKETSLPAGYVISFGEGKDKRIIVAYHGTKGFSDVMDDIDIRFRTSKLAEKDMTVHNGFAYQYGQSRSNLRKILGTHKDEKGKVPNITFTGHSLGGAVCQIAAMDCSDMIDLESTKIVTFGSPRVFSKSSAAIYDAKFEKKTTHITISTDTIPRIPFGAMGYKHTGEKLILPGQGHNHKFYIETLDDKQFVEKYRKNKVSLKDYIVAITKAIKRSLSLSSSKSKTEEIKDTFLSAPNPLYRHNPPRISGTTDGKTDIITK